ncbi:MAG: M23 family metallopeptidase [Gaiellaceae bacterium]
MHTPLTHARRLPTLVGIALLGALALGHDGARTARASTPLSSTASPRISRQFMPAQHSRCEAPRASSLTYNYPIKPFKRQHPIRGYFGDPRTQSLLNAVYAPGAAGPFNLHNGIDIVASTGTAVYPVVSGVASTASDHVDVRTADGRLFQYYHIYPSVRSGQRVLAYTTVVGHTMPLFNHVHFSEIDGGQVHNPLDPGHLAPYRDRTLPQVDAVRFTDSQGAQANPLQLAGQVDVAAAAHDMPALPIAADWPGLGVTVPKVAWSLRTASGRVAVPLRTVTDLRLTEPSNHDFWKVYAAGTHQNKYGDNYPLKIRIVGEYFSNLTPSGSLDTRSLPNGTYVLTVKVADTCGNGSSLSEWITIAN